MHSSENLVAAATTTTPVGDHCIVINILTVKPEKVQALLDQLTRMTQEEVRYAPGFLRATFSLRQDCRAIIMLAHWRSEADLRAMLAGHQDQIARCEELAETVTPMIGTVMCSIHPPRISSS